MVPIRSQRIGFVALLGTPASRMKQFAHSSPGLQLVVVLFHVFSQDFMPILGGIIFQHDASNPSVTFSQSVTASRGIRVCGGEIRGVALQR